MIRGEFHGISLRSALSVGIVVCFSLFLAGCAGRFCRIPRDPLAVAHGDRCFIEDEEFVYADQLYARLGSIALVERHLCEKEQWRTCEINEAVYRLRKVHSLP